MTPARAYAGLDAMEEMARRQAAFFPLDARVRMIVTGCFLLMLLSVDRLDLPVIAAMGVFPAVLTLLARIPFSFILRRAVWALPFVLFVGIFNPLYEREVMLQAGGLAVTTGWISFAAIVLRGLIAVWAALLLVATGGFQEICAGLRRLRVPALITTQLLFVYRYLFVLVDEASAMLLARSLRAGGSTRIPPGEWGALVGSLLLRSLARAQRLHQALTARGFDGELRSCSPSSIGRRDVLFLTASLAGMLLLRFGAIPSRAGMALERLLF